MGVGREICISFGAAFAILEGIAVFAKGTEEGADGDDVGCRLRTEGRNIIQVGSAARETFGNHIDNSDESTKGGAVSLLNDEPLVNLSWRAKGGGGGSVLRYHDLVERNDEVK